MKRRYVVFGLALASVFAVSGIVCGQNAVATSNRYLITARAGGVNDISGEVTIERADGRVGRLLKGDEVQVGERVTTGIDGRAEILMNPGSYVRLGANSSFEFSSTDLDDVRLKVHSGSAILEVFGTDGFHVDLSADTARFTILETGVYRIDARPNRTTTVEVWKGKLRAGNVTPVTLGGGKEVKFDGRTYVVSKFDRDDKDSLAIWSRERSRELSRISASLRPKQLRGPLIYSFYGRHWDLYSSFGLWVFDPFFRSYCFLPFGYGWSSPYGFGFGRSIVFYDLPVAVYKEPPPAGWRGRTPGAPTEPGRTPVNSQNTGKTSDDANVYRRNPPRSEPVFTRPRSEPIFDRPRIEPVPSIPTPKIRIKQP